MSKPPMTFHQDFEAGLGVDKQKVEIYVKLHVTARTSGLMRELGPDGWQTLCCLATYMDGTGFCYPSVEQVGRALGINRNSAMKRLADLCEFRWHDNPIVVKTKARHNGGHFANNRYKILPLSQLSIFDGDVEAPCTVERAPLDSGTVERGTVDRGIVDKALTRTTINKNQNKQDIIASSKPSVNEVKHVEDYDSKDIVHYFARKYKEQYGDDYVINYGQELRLIKTKLIAAFGPEKLVKIVDTVFALYGTKWATVDYPRPTVGQLASWLANKAVAFIDDNKPVEEAPGGELDYAAMMKKLREKRG